MFKLATSCLLLTLLIGVPLLSVHAQDVDDMIIPGQPAPTLEGATTDTTEPALPYPEVYLPPPTTVWLSGTLAGGATGELEWRYEPYNDVTHLHYTITLMVQFRLVDVVSMSVNLGQAATRTTLSIDPETMSFDQYRGTFGNDREAYEEGIARRADLAFMAGMALHVVTSQTDLFAGEASVGFDARAQDYEGGFDFTLMLAARYQPASALRIRLGGMYMHERLTASLSIGVAP